MNEQEANAWFEEKKEEVVKEYFKKMDSLLVEEEKSDEEKKKEEEDTSKKNQKKGKKEDVEDPAVKDKKRKDLIKEYEVKFINNSTKIRKKYDSYVSKSRLKIEKSLAFKNKKQKFFSPFVKLWQTIVKSLKILTQQTKKGIKNFKNYYFEHIGSKNQRKRGILVLKTKRFLWPHKLYYTQNIWPVLHYLNAPNRRLKIILIKAYAQTWEGIKKFIKKIIDISVKVFKKVVGFLKLIFGKISKFIAKIKETNKKIIEFFKRLVSYIKARYFPEKD